MRENYSDLAGGNRGELMVPTNMPSFLVRFNEIVHLNEASSCSALISSFLLMFEIWKSVASVSDGREDILSSFYILDVDRELNDELNVESLSVIWIFHWHPGLDFSRQQCSIYHCFRRRGLMCLVVYYT